GFTSRETIQLPPGNWRLHLTLPDDRIPEVNPFLRHGVLGFGLIFSLLFSGYIQIILGRRNYAEQLAADRTTDLKQANECLELENIERRKAEAEARKLSDAIQQSPVAVIISDIEGHIQYVNPKFLEITIRKNQNLIGMDMQEVCWGVSNPPPEAVEAFSDAWNGRIWQGQVSVKDARDRLHWRVLTIGPITDVDGKVINLLAMMEDITEQKELQDQIAQTRKVKLIGELTGGIAHDFNNIITGIVGFAGMLMDNLTEDEESREFAEQIFTAGKGATALTRQMVTFMRQQEEFVEPLDLNTLVEDSLKLLRKTLGERITLKPDLAREEQTVEADRIKMAQIVMNLCVNARDAMPEGGVITLRTESRDLKTQDFPEAVEGEPGPHVLLSVRDTGTGIPEDVLPRIFESFYTTKAVGEGTGLGLANVKKIVEAFKGFIEVDTAMGEGTEFRVWLPRSNFEALAVEGYKEVGATEFDAHILVVEDEKMTQSVIEHGLGRVG
ncbi:MAG: ATP-binding protein, partial [Verrucomicrobiota bacterium]